MWTYLPDILSRPVPRYTSYPTAMEFSDDVGAADVSAAFDQIAADTPVSFYVHIPFCEKICSYCGCNTGASGRRQRLADYLTALEAEIVMTARRLGGRGKVKRISFGGGSPNALSPLEFIRLLDRIITLFAVHDPNISIEIDPRGFTKDWAQVIAATGVRRVSLGVQSFAPHVQQAMGRIQPAADIEAAMVALRNCGVDQVNFDLMFGLPQQSLQDLDETLDATIRLAPSRIALFGYAHLPALLPRQRRIDGGSLPDHELRFLQAHRGYQRLREAGYMAVGFDHFAMPDDPLAEAARQGRVRRSFQGFTDDDAAVMIGLGSSAISQFPDLIVQNEKRSGVYRDAMMAGGGDMVRGVRVDGDERARGAIIRDLLCRGEAQIGPRYLYEARNALVEYEALGLLRWKRDLLVIAPYALPYSRLIASEFDKKRGAITGQFAFA